MPPGIDGGEENRSVLEARLNTKIFVPTNESIQVWAIDEVGRHGFIPKSQFEIFALTFAG